MDGPLTFDKKEPSIFEISEQNMIQAVRDREAALKQPEDIDPKDLYSDTAGLTAAKILEPFTEKFDPAFWTRQRNELLTWAKFNTPGLARMFIPKEMYDKLPDRPMPSKYWGSTKHPEGGYITPEGEVLPEPPKEWLEMKRRQQAVPRLIDLPRVAYPTPLGTEAAEAILPDTIAHIDETVRGIMQLPYQENNELRQKLLGDLETVGAYYYGPVATKLWGGVASKIGWLMKQFGSLGEIPPRMLAKAIYHPSRLLPGGMKGLGLPAPPESLWEIVRIPATWRVLPTLEGRKSLSEIFIPAIERMARKEQATFRYAQARKANVSSAGELLGAEMDRMLPDEALDTIRALRPGYSPKTPAAKEAIKNFHSRMGSYGLGPTYRKHFEPVLGKQLDLITSSQLTDELYGPLIEKFVDDASLYIRGSGKVKTRDIKNHLANLLKDPTTPEYMQVTLRDLYNLSHTTPEAIAKAAKYASMATLRRGLRNSGMLNATRQSADDILLTNKHDPELAGLWADRDVALELSALTQIPKLAHSRYNKWLMTPWKTSKVIMRPATHMRNMVSNTMLNDIGGMSFLRGDIYAKALSELKSKGPLWREYSRITGAGGTFTLNEVAQLREGLKYGANAFDYAISIFDKIANPARAIYNAEEQWFKLAKYIHNRGKGLSKWESAWDAMKWTFNYGEVTRFTADIRSTISPFFTWQSKVIPLLAESIVNNPFRAGKWWLFYEMLQHNALQSLKIGDHEWDYINTILPDYIQDGQFLLLPQRDEQGRLQLLNLTYMIPGFGDIQEMISDPTTAIFGNPLISIGGALQSKHTFSGAPLYYDWEPGSVKFQKSMSYVWAQLMPSWTPGIPYVTGPGMEGLTKGGGVDWNQMWRMITEGPETGALTPEQVLTSSFGFKIVPIDEAKAARSRAALDRIHKAELEASYRRELRRASSAEQRREVSEKYVRMRKHLLED